MNIEVFTQFIRPELIVVPFILYAIGVAIKKSNYIKDEFIPLILGITSIAICAIYILAMSDTPKTYQELINYEYEKDKNGDVISGYPDKDNHAIDAMRYALERVANRRGDHA